jgi:hypothetical protein
MTTRWERLIAPSWTGENNFWVWLLMVNGTFVVY